MTKLPSIETVATAVVAAVAVAGLPALDWGPPVGADELGDGALGDGGLDEGALAGALTSPTSALTFAVNVRQNWLREVLVNSDVELLLLSPPPPPPPDTAPFEAAWI
jgi:hypothetical protein